MNDKNIQAIKARYDGKCSAVQYLQNVVPDVLLALRNTDREQLALLLEDAMREVSAGSPFPAVDLSGLTRYGYYGIAGMRVDSLGDYLKLTDVQALLASPARDVGGLLGEALAVFDLMLKGCREQTFGDYENGDGDTIGPRMDKLRARLREVLATSPAPSVKQEADDLKMIAHLIGIIFFAGDFKAETMNERELEALLVKTGHRYASWEEIDAATQNLTAPTASQGEVKTDPLEAQIIERRIAITPEYEGGFHAEIYGDEDEPQAKGFGKTPSEAITSAAPAPSVTDGEGK